MRYLTVVATLCCLIGPLHAMDEPDDKETDLERKLRQIENKADWALERSKDAWMKLEKTAPLGIVLFLFGVFCALWAQNTGRNAWVWFFTGILFSVVTTIVLLNKNALDRQERKKDVSSGPG